MRAGSVTICLREKRGDGGARGNFLAGPIRICGTLRGGPDPRARAGLAQLVIGGTPIRVTHFTSNLVSCKGPIWCHSPLPFRTHMLHHTPAAMIRTETQLERDVGLALPCWTRVRSGKFFFAPCVSVDGCGLSFQLKYEGRGLGLPHVQGVVKKGTPRTSLKVSW